MGENGRKQGESWRKRWREMVVCAVESAPALYLLRVVCWGGMLYCVNSTRRQEIEARLVEIRADLTLARQAMRDIASGKKVSYTVGTRQATAYSMSLADLRAWIKELRRECGELENALAGKSRRARLVFIPKF